MQRLAHFFSPLSLSCSPSLFNHTSSSQKALALPPTSGLHGNWVAHLGSTEQLILPGMMVGQWEVDPRRSWHLYASPFLLGPSWMVLRHSDTTWPVWKMLGDQESNCVNFEVEATLVTPPSICFPSVPDSFLLPLILQGGSLPPYGKSLPEALFFKVFVQTESYHLKLSK